MGVKEVKITLSGGPRVLSLAEVQLFAPFVTHGAQIFGGTASQSSNNNYPAAIASLAIDGNLDTMWSGGSVTHTDGEMNPWWKVVLDTEQIIGSIRVYNRGDCCSDRLDDAMIELFNGNGKSVYSVSMGPAQPVNEVFLEGGYTVKEVKITLSGGPRVLSLAEVQLFAPTKYITGGGTAPDAAACPACCSGLEQEEHSVEWFTTQDDPLSTVTASGSEVLMEFAH